MEEQGAEKQLLTVSSGSLDTLDSHVWTYARLALPYPVCSQSERKLSKVILELSEKNDSNLFPNVNSVFLSTLKWQVSR